MRRLDTDAFMRLADDGCPHHQEEDSDCNLNSKIEQTPQGLKRVYDALAEHQVTEDWRHRKLVQELQRWAVIFNAEFQLDIPEVSLTVDWLRFRALGHFRYGFNGFGLRGEIAINERHLHRREPWQVLGTLLHELLHAWQQAHGKPGKGNYHNKEFRDKASDYGLIVDSAGVTQYAAESPIRDLLAWYGIEMPKLSPPILKLPGSSKLKLWFCGCTRVRVAVAHFRACCLNCGNEFLLSE